MSRFATPFPGPPPPSGPSTLVPTVNNGLELTQSMSASLYAPIKELAALTQTLFASLAPASTRPPPPPSIDALLAVDDALRAAVARAREHQVRQRRIERLEVDILELDARWRALCGELEQGRQELGAIIEEGDKRVTAIKEAKESTVTAGELLTYANLLANYTSAPPGLADDLNISMVPQGMNMPMFNPPFPNEEKMGRGRLRAQAPLGGVGETQPIGQPPDTKVTEPSEQTAPGRVQYRADVRPRQPVLDLDLDLDLNPDL